MIDKKYAYTTILSTDSYLPGVLALFESIKKTNTKVSDFVVIVNQEIKNETINRLVESGIIVKSMAKINAPQEIQSKNKLFPHWNNTFDKFNIFNLTDYDKVELFTRTKKKIKSVAHITHTQFSRPVKSITSTLDIRDMKRLIDANLEIANIRPEVESRDKMYINARMVMMPIVLGWLVQKCIHNKIDLHRMTKLEKKER